MTVAQILNGEYDDYLEVISEAIEKRQLEVFIEDNNLNICQTCWGNRKGANNDLFICDCDTPNFTCYKPNRQRVTTLPQND